MIIASFEEAKILLADWKERGIWIGADLVLREDARESHRFWAKILKLAEVEVFLEGEFALVRLPLESAAEFGYLETSEIPIGLRECFSGFNFCFTIRSHKVTALLFGGSPKPE